MAYIVQDSTVHAGAVPPGKATERSGNALGGITMAGGSDLRRRLKAILYGSLVWCAGAGALVFQLWAGLPHSKLQCEFLVGCGSPLSLAGEAFFGW